MTNVERVSKTTRILFPLLSAIASFSMSEMSSS